MALLISCDGAIFVCWLKDEANTGNTHRVLRFVLQTTKTKCGASEEHGALVGVYILYSYWETVVELRA